MEHSFDIDIATKYGIDIAIVYKHILFWIIKNKAHNKNYKDGSYWTYFSVNSLHSIFPYFTTKQLRTILDKMKEQNIIKVGNYNTQKYDRTLWYAFVEEPEELRRIVSDIAEKGNSIFPNGQMEVPKEANGFSQTGLPIPYNKTYIKTNNKKDIIIETKKIEPVKKKSPQAIMGDYFRSIYKRHTGYEYLAKAKDYILLAELIKEYGIENVKQKIDWLEVGCKNRIFWFTKESGINSFTIGKLYLHWNEILPQYTAQQIKEQEEKKKEEERMKRVLAEAQKLREERGK